MKKVYYAGIGSRETPIKILESMRLIASVFAKHGLILRSGGAEGADTAFEEGCLQRNGSCEIWIPWINFQQRKLNTYLPTEEHYLKASTLHPVWDRLSRGPRSLHARNVCQVLGMDLNTPVSFVVCYTRDGATSFEQVTQKTGGTGTAIKLASSLGIPVINMFNKDYTHQLKEVIKSLDID